MAGEGCPESYQQTTFPIKKIKESYFKITELWELRNQRKRILMVFFIDLFLFIHLIIIFYLRPYYMYWNNFLMDILSE